jgi:uncharacterized Tic20 family protein
MESPSSVYEPFAPSGNDRLWSMLGHLSIFFGVGIILPAIVYLAMRHDSEYVASNAKEALNFQISVLLYVLCCLPLTLILIGVPLMILIGLGSLVLGVLAAVRASQGQLYRYPLTLRLVA